MWFVRGFARGHPDFLRQSLKAVFEVAPDCTEAKMLEAELMFDEGDYGGERLPFLRVDVVHSGGGKK
jgi:hypothetical protein